MKKLGKLLAVALGSYMAITSASMNVKANQINAAGDPTGSCVKTGDCGTTAGGVKLNGFWRESKQ